MTDFQRACAVSEIPDSGALRVMLEGTPICLVRSDGEIHALYDVCSHAEVPLSEGDVDGDSIECWLHGSRFDLATGAPSGLPAITPVAVYPTKTEGEDVYVSLQKEN